jgi:hypothetical protein
MRSLEKHILFCREIAAPQMLTTTAYFLAYEGT